MRLVSYVAVESLECAGVLVQQPVLVGFGIDGAGVCDLVQRRLGAVLLRRCSERVRVFEL